MSLVPTSWSGPSRFGRLAFSAALVLVAGPSLLGCDGASPLPGEGAVETSTPAGVSAAQSQALYQDGCSAPWLANVALGALTFSNPSGFFAPECRVHDYCYHSGRAAYGVSRATCDDQFYSGMTSHCTRSYSWYNPMRAQCISAAQAFYYGVRGGGEEYFLRNRCVSGEVNSTSCSTFELYEDTRTPAFTSRIGIVDGAGTLIAKEGGLSTLWSTLIGGTSKVQIDGFRIAALVGTSLYAKEGELSALWVKQLDNVADFHLSGNRLAVRLTNGAIYAREGGLSPTTGLTNITEPTYDSNCLTALGLWHSADKSRCFTGYRVSVPTVWTSLGSGKKVQLEGARVAVLDNNNTLLAKEGALNAAWVTQLSNVTDFQLENDRIAALVNGSLTAKMGSLSATWYAQSPGGTVTRFQLEGSRMAVLRADGALMVKDGAPHAGPDPITEAVYDQSCMLYVNDQTKCYIGTRTISEGSPWTVQAGGVTDFQLRGTRIGVVTGGALYVKDGALNATWMIQIGNVKQMALSGDRIGALLNDGVLMVKEGALYATWVTEATAVRSFQLWSTPDWERSDYR